MVLKNDKISKPDLFLVDPVLNQQSLIKLLSDVMRKCQFNAAIFLVSRHIISRDQDLEDTSLPESANEPKCIIPVLIESKGLL